MKTRPPLFPFFIRAGLLCLVGGVICSCTVPPRVAWQRIKEQGVVRGLFNPRRERPPATDSQMASDTSWGSATIEGRQSQPAADAPPIPSAEPFAGKVGFVYSPHTNPKKLVNVAGFAAGEQVLCPYTLEPFVVPSFLEGPALTGVTAPLPLMFGPEAPPRQNPPSDSIDLVSRENNPALLPPPREAPYGKWVEGKPGFVFSPFAAKHQLVDVTGIESGVEVRCPYTRQVFRVPEAPGVGELPELPAPSEPSTSIPINPAPPMPAIENKKGSSGRDTPAVAGPTQPADLPVAKWADGKPGLVQSPFGETGQLIDVSGKEAGTRVVCPFSGKPFLVPVQ